MLACGSWVVGPEPAGRETRTVPKNLRADAGGLPTLQDDDVVTNRVDRRTFFTRLGLGSAAAAALGLTLLGGCGGSDKCDSDFGSKADTCDTDR